MWFFHKPCFASLFGAPSFVACQSPLSCLRMRTKGLRAGTPALGSQHAGICSQARQQTRELKKLPSSLTPCPVSLLGLEHCVRKVLMGEKECKFIRRVLRFPFTLKITSQAAAGSSPGLPHFLELQNGRQPPRRTSLGYWPERCMVTRVLFKNIMKVLLLRTPESVLCLWRVRP